MTVTYKIKTVDKNSETNGFANLLDIWKCFWSFLLSINCCNACYLKNNSKSLATNRNYQGVCLTLIIKEIKLWLKIIEISLLTRFIGWSLSNLGKVRDDQIWNFKGHRRPLCSSSECLQRKNIFRPPALVLFVVTFISKQKFGNCLVW